MKKLHVAFVWHMHQPLYKDELTQRYYLPWVRLHALKGYYDMPALVEKFPKIKQVYNLTPSLLYQLNDYLENPNIKDDFLEATLKPAAALTNEDKEFILTNFFMNNWPKIVKPHPRYAELLNKRGHSAEKSHIQSQLSKFDEAEYRDLQTLFNLTWFGYSFRKKEPRLQELIRKGKNYTEEEKIEVIDFQFKAMSEIIPLYKRGAESGQLELTTTPFYHPILPLLNNKTLGYGYSWEEDARWQVRRGIHYFERCFGFKPQGMWPAEGSVSQDVVPLFADEGIRWIASDEEILFRSQVEDHQSFRPGNREQTICAPYNVISGDKSIAMVYRDKKLSDLIGFSYANSDAESACNDFIGRLHKVREQASGSNEEILVSVILDGENAWEHYPYGGERFLSLLYERLSDDPSFETTTVGEFIQKFPPTRTVSKLFGGSWINHNFNIWYGHEEDRIAWDYLDRTRSVLHQETGLTEEIKRQAWEEIYAAEGSDWYWWFGDDFSSFTDHIFDFLFRNHLMNVYKLIDKRPPAYLKKPIKQFRKVRVQQEPAAFIHPQIDGRVTTFYEWANAGLYKIDNQSEVMQRNDRFISEIYYGFDLENFYLRLDFFNIGSKEDLEKKKGVLRLSCSRENKSSERPVDFDVHFQFKDKAAVQVFAFEGEKREQISELSGSFAIQSIAEIRVPFRLLELKKGDEVQFNISIENNGILIEEWPKHGILSFRVPDESFESMMWSV